MDTQASFAAAVLELSSNFQKLIAASQKMELLTASQVAGLLGSKENTIWNWQYGRRPAPVGFPPPVKIGALVRWKSTDIHAFMAILGYTKTGRIVHADQNSFVNKSVTESVLRRGRGRPRKVSTVLA